VTSDRSWAGRVKKAFSGFTVKCQKQIGRVGNNLVSYRPHRHPERQFLVQR
jgi:hypothetical protein